MTRLRLSRASLVLAAAFAGCKSPRVEAPFGPAPMTPATLAPAPGEIVLDRGNWLVGDQCDVWKVLVEPREGRPVHLGYVVRRQYREVRGGPQFAMYEVTSHDRGDQV